MKKPLIFIILSYSKLRLQSKKKKKKSKWGFRFSSDEVEKIHKHWEISFSFYLSSPQITFTCKIGTTRAAPKILAMTTASTIWFLCWFNPPDTTTIRYFLRSLATVSLHLRYSRLTSKHGRYPNPSGCSQNPSSPSSDPLDKIGTTESTAEIDGGESPTPEHSRGDEKGRWGSRSKPIRTIPRRDRRMRERNQNLGFLKGGRNLVGHLEGFLGERRRDWREEEERDVIISEGTEM